MYRTMENKNNVSKKTKYTVLAHTFHSFDEACEYVNRIVSKGASRIIPPVKVWREGKVVAQWGPTVTKDGISYKSNCNVSI